MRVRLDILNGNGAPEQVTLPHTLVLRAQLLSACRSDVGAGGLAGYFGLVGELLSSTWRLMSPWTVG